MTTFRFEAKNVEFRAPASAIAEAAGCPAVPFEEFAAFPADYIMALIERTQAEIYGTQSPFEMDCAVTYIANQGSCPRAEPGIDGTVYYTEHLSCVRGLYDNGCGCPLPDEDEREAAIRLLDVYLLPAHDIVSDTYYNVRLEADEPREAEAYSLGDAPEVSREEACRLTMDTRFWEGRTFCISSFLAIYMDEWEGCGDEPELEGDGSDRWVYYTLISRMSGQEYTSGAFGYLPGQTFDEWLHAALCEDETEHLYE